MIFVCRGWTVFDDPYKKTVKKQPLKKHQYPSRVKSRREHQEQEKNNAGRETPTPSRAEPKNYRIDEEPAIIYYKHPYIFQTILPDKSGCVYYPNGRLAILLSDTGMYQSFILFHYDRENPMQLANFDSNGSGYCNHINGKIRYLLFLNLVFYLII